jgi:hypothetical protein
MAKQQLNNPDALTFYKWEKVGQSITVVIEGEPVFDKPNSFGSKDSFIIGRDSEGNRVQVPLTTDAKARIKPVLELLVDGITTLTLTFTGTRAIKGKSPLKLFTVEADGLKES